jgi:anti-sigma regulatory factor (Ser/Thr protein kinase)
MGPPWQTDALRVTDESGVGEVRRAARRAARALGLDEVATEHAAIVATEASRNVAVHGHGGLVLLTGAPGGALDVLALDRGPGIPDLGRALTDGFSTGGTAGQGLGAMCRLAAAFDVYSAPGRGTAVLARVSPSHPVAGRPSLEAGGVCVALATETECGDAWAVDPSGAPGVLVADGLGHGAKAAEAAAAAVAAFRAHAGQPAEAVLEAIHRALRPTRGAAVAVAQGSADGAHVRFAGIGNISGAVLGSPHVRRLVSLAGTAGHEARSLRAFDHEWRGSALLVIHSDGISGRFDPADYPGLAQRHPALIAGVLYRDFARGRDDATVVVARRHP